MMCVVNGRLDNKDLGTVMHIKKRNLVPLFCQVVIILIMQSLQRPTAVIQRIVTYFNGFVFISFVFYYFYFEI
jgi:hypothetical protein